MADDSQAIQQLLDSSLPTAPRTEADPLDADMENKRLANQRSGMVDRDKKRDELLNLPFQSDPDLYKGNRTVGQVLEDEAAPVELKTRALKQASQYESNIESQKSANRLDAYNKWSQKVKEVNDFNKGVEALGYGKKVAVPTPDKFGLTTADVVEAQNSITDPNVQAENEKRAQQAALEAQRAAQEQAKQVEQQQVAEGEAEAQKQRNNMDGFIAKQEKISQDMQSAYQKQIEALDDEQNKLSEVDPNRFWSNLSTGQKILGAISIGLGSIGGALSKTGGNVALDIINKAIDNDISAQKVNNEQKLALKQNALKRAALEVDRLSELSKDQERKFQMKQVSDQLRANEQALMGQRANQKALVERIYSSGLTPEEADTFLDEKQVVRKVSLPDGNITLAVSPNAANQYTTAINGVTSARKLTDKVAGKVKNYSSWEAAKLWGEQRSTLEGDVEALIGALRLPITGPGILNEKEYERIMGKVVGNPASFFTVNKVTEAKMRSLQDTLKMIERANLETATGKKWMTNEDRARIKLIQDGTPLEDIDAHLQEVKRRNPDFYSK